MHLVRLLKTLLALALSVTQVRSILPLERLPTTTPLSFRQLRNLSFPQTPTAIYNQHFQNNENALNASRSEQLHDDDDSSEIYHYTPPRTPRPSISLDKRFCEPEEFQHLYITDSEAPGVLWLNRWKRARNGTRVGLHDVCLKANGLPLTRKCLFNSVKQVAEWENITYWPLVKCLREPSQHIISVKLNTLHDEIIEGKRLQRGREGRQEVTRSVCDILEERNYKLLPADVHFTSQILREVTAEAQDSELSPEMVSICGALMASDRHVLRLSADINATNSLLDTFETYMDQLSAQLVEPESCKSTISSKLTAAPSAATTNASSVINKRQHAVETISYPHLGVYAHLSANVSVFFVNPVCANVTGIAIFEPHARTRRTLFREVRGEFSYGFIYAHERANEIATEAGLQAATFLPQTLWQHVQSRVVWPKLVFKVYSHDALFVEQSLVQTHKPYSKILSISIPGYDAQFPEELPFLLRNQHTSMSASQSILLGTGCAYWNYGEWVNAGVHTQSAISAQLPVVLCGTRHLTQFSFLVGGNYRQNDLSGEILITPAHLRALDIISLVGCSLSLLGLIGIWLTAALFKSWRSLSSTKVLLNLCVALTLQMVLFVFVNTDDMSQALVESHSYTKCVLLGAFMQYSILVLFVWMLIVAGLQYQRYVTVIGFGRPRHYILKAALVAWGVPLLPTLLVACIDPGSYIPTNFQLHTDSGICYPSGYGLTFGVVLPICMICVANLTIFVYVFYSISHSLNQTMPRSERKLISKQVRLSVLLFFLLGLSWIFGLFAFMKAGILFSFLFCLTATMQGFVLFVYFVLLDEVAREAWRKLLWKEQEQKSGKRLTEMQSMTTTSTGVTSEAREARQLNQSEEQA